ncbi:MAG: dTDP-glucose 4,6-dehydratase, partial [Planctomycetota bacterium]
MRLLLTGGAGFIGTNLTYRLLADCGDEIELTIVDKLTYAGNKRGLERALQDPRVRFVQSDIADGPAMRALFAEVRPTGVLHLAAESHVDRSITGPAPFIDSNIVGTFTLLECARALWCSPVEGNPGAGDPPGRFLHVSTDEVYGDLGPSDPAFTEETPYRPSSPYSASKAASDHLVRAYARTYGLDVVITNCSNNFGPYQHPEKLIPTMIRSIRDRAPLPVYGDGMNVRDWLYVEDHCEALWLAFQRGSTGRSYNIGTENEWANLDLVKLLCDTADDILGRPPGSSRELIAFVTDR